LEEQIGNHYRKTRDSSAMLLNSIQGLSVSSQEISATSTLQAAAVKEIVSTMEDSNILNQEMSRSVGEVVKIAMQTKNQVEKGFEYVKNSLAKMEEIKNKNMDTINGIRSLGDKIESIWDIVNIINGIINQTKIIAFNAALEASSASEGGKNFQIVASEIKRLADNTMSSTKEIKAKINEIQRSSNNLIIISEDGTQRIKEGWELAQNLEAVFEDILNSAEISANASGNIDLSINQQASAVEQILLTLKEISSGIESFVASTRQTSQTIGNLKGMADELNKIVEKFRLE
jgi:methyl-accepting chemotaxis protein